MRAPSLHRTGFLATLAVGVGLLASSLYGLAQVGEDLEIAAAARPDATLVAHEWPAVDGYDCPRGAGAPDGRGERL